MHTSSMWFGKRFRVVARSHTLGVRVRECVSAERDAGAPSVYTPAAPGIVVARPADRAAPQRGRHFSGTEIGREHVLPAKQCSVQRVAVRFLEVRSSRSAATTLDRGGVRRGKAERTARRSGIPFPSGPDGGTRRATARPRSVITTSCPFFTSSMRTARCCRASRRPALRMAHCYTCSTFGQSRESGQLFDAPAASSPQHEQPRPLQVDGAKL